MPVKIIVLFVFIFTVSFSDFYSQTVRPYITNFTPKEYGDSCHAQNWAVVQDARGIMYFGNIYRLLEYDGENWNNIRIPVIGLFVTSLLSGVDGKIYIGANNEFGFLKPDTKGKLVYQTLTRLVPSDARSFGNIWRIYNYKNGILFFSEKIIFIYTNEKIEIIRPKTSFHLCFVVNDELYVRQRETGLMKYKNNNLDLIRNGDIFSNYGVFGIFPVSPEKFIIVTQEKGLFEYDPENKDSSIVTLKINDTKFLNESQIIGGISLRDGNIALNTASKGVIIIDKPGHVLQIINEKTGIADNDVKQVFQDKYDNLWLVTNNGISRVNYSSTASYFDEKAGLYGSVNSVIKFNGKIFAGTSGDLYSFAQNINSGQSVFFEKIPGINRNISELICAQGTLLIGTSNGLFTMDKSNKVTTVSELSSTALWYSDKLKLLFAAGTNGLSIYKFVNRWTLVKLLREVSADALKIIESKETDPGQTSLWIGTLKSGVWNINIMENLNTQIEAYYGKEDGLEESWIIPFTYNHEVLFSTNAGVRIFLDAETLNKSMPDSLRKKMNLNRGIFDVAHIKPLAKTIVTSLIQGEKKSFAVLNGKPAIIDKQGIVSYHRFSNIDMGKINSLYLENDSLLWISANNGLVKYELFKTKNLAQKPDVILRKVSGKGDNTLFNGNFFSGDSLIVSNQVIKDKVIVNYANNTLKFNFSSSYNEDGHKTLYSFKLAGIDDDWSEWSDKPEAKYNKLHEGSYCFLLKTKNIYNAESDTISYCFQILPPWYRTWWSYVLYVILLVFAVYGVIRLYTYRLRAKNLLLEKIVRERTAEISKQKDEITSHRDTILHQKEEIEDSIKYAKSIQNAVLSKVTIADGFIHEYFILFKPKDIVSGDFYYSTTVGCNHIFAVADCTGHGVPGAFMSMLGVALLNEIIRRKEVTQASQVLDELRDRIIEALHQKGLSGEQKDGMDIAFCVLDTETLMLQFAGANNPLYIVETGDSPVSTIREIRPDKMPVAIYEHMEPFTNHTVQMKNGDMIYLGSDGYEDQFGGPKGKKFFSKNLRQLIVANCSKPMAEQKEIFDKTIEDWKNNHGEKCDQTDDITLMGIKI